MPKFKGGEWFKLTHAQQDTGDFGQRHAQAGSLAFIGKVLPDQENCYMIVAWPSGVGGFWSEAEVAENATSLPPDHDDIPSEKALDLVDAVALVFSDGDAEDDSSTVIVSAQAVATLREHSAESAIEKWVIDNVEGPYGKSSTLIYQQADALAAMVGLGDRYNEPKDPFAGRIEVLFPNAETPKPATTTRMAP